MWKLLFTALLFLPAAQAASSKPPLAEPSLAEPVQAEPPKRWSGELEARYNGSFLHPEDEDRKSSLLVVGKGVYQPSDRATIQGTWGFNQIIEPWQEFTLTNPEFRVFYRVLGETGGWLLSIGPTAALPLSQDSIDQSLYFAVGAAARIVFNQQDEEEVGFSIFYDLGLNRNIHQYETSNTGDQNFSSSLDHYVEGTYSFESSWSVMAWFGFSSAWTYLGDISNNYTLGQEVGYSMTDQLELGLGHERGGDFLSPNGQSYNFGLYNAQESRFYLLLRLSI